MLDEVPGAARLHCVYVAADRVEPVERKHPTWASGELYPRALGGIARAELHRFGLVLAGPPVAELLPPVDAEALRAAVPRGTTPPDLDYPMPSAPTGPGIESLLHWPLMPIIGPKP